MQNTYETHEIYGCNICLSTYCLSKWRPVNAELNTSGAELISGTDVARGHDWRSESGRDREARRRRRIRTGGRRATRTGRGVRPNGCPTEALALRIRPAH
jgi:hypothetical protein